MKKLTICGNVGRDPEVRIDSNGTSFATFSVAVSVGNKANPKTDWIEVSCNGRLVDIANNYVRKGGKVLVEGFPTVGAYINNDNLPVGSLRLFAHTLELLTRPENKSVDALSTNHELEELAVVSHSNLPTTAEEIVV